MQAIGPPDHRGSGPTGSPGTVADPGRPWLHATTARPSSIRSTGATLDVVGGTSPRILPIVLTHSEHRCERCPDRHRTGASYDRPLRAACRISTHRSSRSNGDRRTCTWVPWPSSDRVRTRSDDGVDIETIRRLVASRLDQIPRYRQRSGDRAPSRGIPSGSTTSTSTSDYHVRHIALPHPGTEDQLKSLVGQPHVSAARSHPTSVGDCSSSKGLEDGGFAIVSKIHHCMIDGMSGIDLMAVILDFTPDVTIENRSRGRRGRRPTARSSP